jgi:hypothetical protein
MFFEKQKQKKNSSLTSDYAPRENSDFEKQHIVVDFISHKKSPNKYPLHYNPKALQNPQTYILNIIKVEAFLNH